MFNWLKRKPKLDTVGLVNEAKGQLLHYLAHGDHSELVNIFRMSVIENEDTAQFLMTEIHVGSVIQKLSHALTHMNIIIYSEDFNQHDMPHTIFIKDRYIVNSTATQYIIIRLLLIHLGYKDVNSHCLPTMLGRFISESSKV